MKTQEQLILTRLEAGFTINPLQALDLYGCFRLGARIYDLRRKGHPIEMTLQKSKNGKHFAIYSLKKS